METLVLTLIVAAAATAVAAPVFRVRSARTGGPGMPADLLDDAALDREVTRYREALRAGTVCARCRFANPRDSRFCADCGKRLPGTWREA